MKNNKKLVVNKSGFTLIEIVVTVAVIGLLMTTISAIFINTLRNANQASIINEAKGNSTAVLDTLERDVRNASDAALETGTTEIKLSYSDGTFVYWNCITETVASALNPKSNGYIKRGLQKMAEKTATNQDPTTGISVSSCNFSISGSNQKLVTFNFTLTEGAKAHSLSEDFGVHLSYTLSVGTRTF